MTGLQKFITERTRGLIADMEVRTLAEIAVILKDKNLSNGEKLRRIHAVSVDTVEGIEELKT